MVGGLASAWHGRPRALRIATLLAVVVIVCWHVCLSAQRYVLRRADAIVPAVLPWPLEVVSIGMGATLAAYGFTPPLAVLPCLMGCLGAIICAGHGLVLFRVTECYYAC